MGNDYRALDGSGLHETRFELLERFKSARATSAENPMALDLGTLSEDERWIFDGLVKDGAIVEWRDGYYLDEDALRSADRPALRLALIGGAVMVALIGGMLWLTMK
jgi:hypothetical protein